jgi:toxin ParE1/3/4
MYRLSIYPEVETQLSEYYRWYVKQKENLGNEFLDSVDEAIKAIERNPFAFQKRIKNYRIYLIDRFPYGIFYLVNEKAKTVLVAAVYHLRINPKTIRRKISKKQ